MKHRFISREILSVSITLLLLGPTPILGLETQRGITIEGPRAVVTGLRGEVSRHSTKQPQDTSSLKFRDVIQEGDSLTTSPDSTAEILLGSQALASLAEQSELEIIATGKSQPVMRLKQGSLQVAVVGEASGPDPILTIESPSSRITTRGGIVKIELGTRTDTESIHVLEGRAQIADRSSSASSLNHLAQLPGGPRVIKASLTSQHAQGPPANQIVTLEAGQSLQITAGTFAPPLTSTGMELQAVSIPAYDQHARTPEPTQQVLVNSQIKQASALGELLVTAGEQEAENEKKTEGVIIATTANLLVPVDVPLFGSSEGSLEGGSLVSTSRSGSSPLTGLEGLAPAGFANLEVRIPGGEGLINFSGGLIKNEKGTVLGKSEINNVLSTTELLLVTGGDPRKEPPTIPLYVGGLSGDNSSIITALASWGPPNWDEPEIFGEAYFHKDSFPQTMDNGELNQDFENVLREQWCLFPNCRSDPEAEPIRLRKGAIVKGFVHAQSPTTGTIEERTINLWGGVTLSGGSKITVSGGMEATENYFASINVALEAAGKPKIPTDDQLNGSVIALVATEDPNKLGTFHSALAKLEDRALAVLDGSTIKPEDDQKIALLSILDSQLTGPGPTLGDVPERVRNERDGTIPPLFEVIGKVMKNESTGENEIVKSEVTAHKGIFVHSSGVEGVDEALLAATAPLFIVKHSDLSTTSHLIHVKGENARLDVATRLPGDAIVRLDAANLLINGNFLQVSGGATASVNGQLFSLTNGSTLTIKNGVLVSVTGGSIFNLTANSFGSFGNGKNTFTISNNLCANGAACSDFGGFKVAGVGGKKPGEVTIPKNFTTFTAADGGKNQIVNMSENDALLQVGAGSRLQLTSP